MNTAKHILESLDATEIRQQIEAIEKEREALLILHRAAIRLERQDKPARHQRPAAEGVNHVK